MKGIGTIIKQRGKLKFPKWLLISCLVLVFAAAALTTVGALRANKGNEDMQEQRTAVLKKGDLTVALSGSGSLTPSVREDISSNVPGDVLSVNFDVGDTVNEGDILLEIDNSDALLSFEKLKNNLEQKKLSYENLQKSINGMTISAPFSGRITNVSVSTGDNANKNAVLMTLTDQSKLKAVLSFTSISGISQGSKAKVNLQELLQSIEGTVTYVNDKPYVSTGGTLLYNVEIQIPNPGLIVEGMEVSAEISTAGGVKSSSDTGKLSYIDKSTIKAQTTGDVIKVNVVDNQYVNSGQVLVLMHNDDTMVSKDSAALQVKELEMQLELAEKELDYYSIKSPIKGTIVSIKTINPGDQVKAGTVLMTIVNTDQMEFDVAIDELDISRIEIGQSVNVSVDAISQTLNSPLSGEVSQIAVESKSSNGVTTYPVTITLPGAEGLRGGMNTNAEILVENKQDVLLVPIEAVTMAGNSAFVWVVGEAPSVQDPNGPDTGDASQSQQNPRQRQGQMGQQGQNPRGNMTEEQRAAMRKQIEESGGDREAIMEQFRQAQNNGGPVNAQTAENNYYNGAYRKTVQTGVNNETYIEVISGLEEGDIVVLPPLAVSSSSQESEEGQNNSSFRMPGMGGALRR